MKCVYLLVTVAVLCLSAETAFAQQSADFVRAPAIVDPIFRIFSSARSNFRILDPTASE